MWPAESSLDERSLEQEYHESHARHFERLAEKRFRQLLKVRIQPRWKFTGVPPAEREHLRDEIDNLIVCPRRKRMPNFEIVDYTLLCGSSDYYPLCCSKNVINF